MTGAALETEAGEDSEEVAAEINVKHIAMYKLARAVAL